MDLLALDVIHAYGYDGKADLGALFDRLFGELYAFFERLAVLVEREVATLVGKVAETPRNQDKLEGSA